MDFFACNSDLDYAYRLQMEEVLAASLSSSSRSPQRPPSPPIVATCGILIAVENHGDGLTPTYDSADFRFRNRGYDFGKTIVEGTSKGKGRIHESVTGFRSDERNPNSRVCNFQNAFENDIRSTSSVPCLQETVRLAHLVGEGSSKVNSAVAGNFNRNVLYRLYFKGLVNEEIGKGKMTDVVAGFGIALCDLSDNLIFEMKGPLIDCGTNRQGAEIKALIRGLTEALKLGIKRVSFCCDSYPIFQFVTRKWVPKQKKISLLINELDRIRHRFPFNQPVLVAGKDVKFAYKLARESIVSQINPHEDPRQGKAARKEECVICYNDIDLERMFSVDKCQHRFCSQCMKQHVEVKLLHGMIPTCPHDGCKSKLVINSCGKLLTPKLCEMWKQRIKENAIPVTERVYCPYPKCSALMSKTKISEQSLMSVYPISGVRRCVECQSLFCVNCKVPWHSQLSCTEYKKLHPDPPTDDVKLKSLANLKRWRQCGKCQHMIELKQGCNHITCRCRNEFCYNCGGEWNKKTGTCTKGCPAWDEAHIMRQDPLARINYIDEDEDEDFDSDYEDEDDDDDYDFFGGYHNHLRYLGVNDHKEPFDPFFDLPDGVMFYVSGDDSDDMHYHGPVPVNTPASRKGKAVEEMGQQNNNASSSNATRVNTLPNEEEYEDADDDFSDFKYNPSFY